MEFVLVGLTVIYLLPWIASEATAHPRHYWILALNIAVGWTGIGWLLLLAWACESQLRRLWKRPTRLYVVGSEEMPPRRPPWERLGRYLAPALGVVAFAGLACWLVFAPPQRTAASEPVELVRASTVLRSGPGEAWPSLGTLEAPCLMRLLERDGEWLRIRRLSDCPGSMTQRSGWLRSADLTLRWRAAGERSGNDRVPSA